MSKIAPSLFGSARSVVVPLEEVVEAVKERTSWPFMREVLKKNGIPPGNGWAILLANSDSPMADGVTVEQFLRKFHSEIVVSGERYVKVYELKDDDVSHLSRDLASAVALSNDFSAKYPMPLTNQLLRGMEEAPALVDVRRYSNGDCCLVYCSSRSYEHRETYQYGQLGEEIQAAYKGIDQLITIERRYFQAYDVVYFRKSLARLEVCVDQPKRGGKRVAENALNRLLTALCLQSNLFAQVFQSQPLNLFRSISGIYKTAGEGTIKTLSFRTLTGSTKTEVMQSPNDDLRAEEFHSAGAQAVGNQIRPFEIEVDFQFVGTSHTASIILAAPIRELSIDPPHLNHCIISTDNSDAISLAVNKLVKYLPDND